MFTAFPLVKIKARLFFATIFFKENILYKIKIILNK